MGPIRLFAREDIIKSRLRKCHGIRFEPIFPAHLGSYRLLQPQPTRQRQHSGILSLLHSRPVVPNETMVLLAISHINEIHFFPLVSISSSRNVANKQSVVRSEKKYLELGKWIHLLLVGDIRRRRRRKEEHYCRLKNNDDDKANFI